MADNTIFMMSRVCVEFRDNQNNLIHRVTPALRNQFHYAPEAIKQDPIFDLLVADGSIQTPEPNKKGAVRELENDPMAGAGADGKTLTPEDGEKETGAAEDKPRKSRSKTAEKEEK